MGRVIFYEKALSRNRTISCASCHGKVNEMEVVYQAENHSMGWCLECHRNPEEHLRPLDAREPHRLFDFLTHHEK